MTLLIVVEAIRIDILGDQYVKIADANHALSMICELLTDFRR